ncbi:MAG: DUF4982 domain-containing protein [Lachnospiraceae bacterium]|nr:DUF4982 domain-containing protein [Lachnospiraceae bacterium]
MYLTGNGVREQVCFDTDWYFRHGEEPIPKETEASAYRRVTLPHDWSLEFPFDEHAPSCGSGGYVTTGIGWYRKRFAVLPEALEDARVTLRFDGVYMLAQVWLNGTLLGRHVYGYTPFEWDITELLRKDGGENSLEVRVDNSAQPASRWYSGSGITRDVWLIRTKKVHVEPYGVWLCPLEVTAECAVLRAETRVKAEGMFKEAPGAQTIRIETELFAPDGSLCAQAGTDASWASEKIVSQKLTVEKPVLWTTDAPALYQAVTRVYVSGILQDEVRTATGLRSAVFDSQQGFLLNGERTKLNGVCLHHDGGCVGAAVHPRIWERRLKKLKEMGANAIRTAHNPPDPALLDLCDRMGFLVMDEAFDEWGILKWKSLGSNTHESRGYSEWFESCGEEDLRKMLLRDRNHPSVILWSIGNEVPDQCAPGGYLTARRLKGICKALDPTRAVTQANDQICAEPWSATEDFLNELDVVGYNYVGRWRTRAETLYDDDRRTHPGWCVIGTENGGMGGARGQYPMEMADQSGWWRRPYYSAPVEAGRLLRYTMTHDFVAGDFMWTGADYLGEAHWPERSSSAGVLDTCGFEKDGYYFYQSIWKRDEPMAHLLPHWNLKTVRGTVVPVLGYTNCEYAELFLNGKSYGRKAMSYPAYGMTERFGHFEKTPVPAWTEDLFLSWDVPYEPGCIELAGYQDGKEVVRHTVYTAGPPRRLLVSCDCANLTADGRDVGQIEVEIQDEKGRFCPDADLELTFTVEGCAALIGVDAGNPASHESMKGNRIRAFAGRAFAVIRSDGNAGTSVIRVSGKTVAEESIEINFLDKRD